MHVASLVAPPARCRTNYVMCASVVIAGGGVSSGVILQRFPEKDWPDTPFIEGIEWVKLFPWKDRFVTLSCHSRAVYHLTVLSTARMGFVNGKARATLLCFDIDGYRCKSTLLCLHVLQRNGIDRAKQTCGRGRRSRRWR